MKADVVQCQALSNVATLCVWKLGLGLGGAERSEGGGAWLGWVGRHVLRAASAGA